MLRLAEFAGLLHTGVLPQSLIVETEFHQVVLQDLLAGDFQRPCALFAYGYTDLEFSGRAEQIIVFGLQWKKEKETCKQQDVVSFHKSRFVAQR